MSFGIRPLKKKNRIFLDHFCQLFILTLHSFTILLYDSLFDIQNKAIIKYEFMNNYLQVDFKLCIQINLRMTENALFSGRF